MFPLLLLSACIERVTDVAVPLDPAFYAGGGEAENPSGAKDALGIPWADATGEKTDVQFTITGAAPEQAVQIDVVEADAAAPGGNKRLGRVETTTGSATLSVPKAVKSFSIEVFADPSQDGPSADDPYAAVVVDMGQVGSAPVAISLVVGARPAAGNGGGGGGGVGPGGGSGGAQEPWSGYAGETVVFTGELSSTDDGEIQVDVAEFDATQPGGQKRVGQLRLSGAGAFTLEVPKTLEKFRIEAFQDREGDGPSTDDPYAELVTVVAQITAEPVALNLVAGSRGSAGSGGGAPPGGAPGGGGPTPGGGVEAPWSTWTGSSTTFHATVVAPGTGEVQVDVNEPDPKAQGGQKRVGQVRLQGSGTLEFKVPSTVSSFRLEAFQDPGHDGPSETDPYAELTVKAAELSATPTLTLVAGARGQPAGPGEGEGAGARAPAAPPPEQDTMPTGPAVKLSGKLNVKRAVPVIIDLFQPAEAAGKGRKHLYKLKPNGKTWSALVPQGIGPLEIDAYQDLSGDGPSGDDPQVHYSSPIVVKTTDLSDLDLTLP